MEALAMDGTTSRDSDSWSAVVYPDPSSEPGIQLTLDPSITNLNPQVATATSPSSPPPEPHHPMTPSAPDPNRGHQEGHPAR